MRRKQKNYFWVALGISFLALLLRLYQLGEIPISLHWDEASWGYNAYSILKTGRDEYGQFLPLIFKAFGDYKAPIYVYLTSFSIALFGLSEFAIRFPAAFFGALDVFLLFFFTRELFYKFKRKELIGFLASLVLMLSPWHYDYSHGAWEANILFAFFLLGLIFFFKAIRQKPSYFFWSAVFFGLCFYVYSAAKLILPLTGLGILFFFGKETFRKITLRRLILAGLLFIILVSPVVCFTFFKGAGGRLKVMSIFSYSRSQEEAQEIAQIEKTTVDSLKYRLFHGDFHYFFRGIFHRYLNHFSPRFLFFEGDWSDFRHGIPDFGVLNYFDLVFLLLGAGFLISRQVLGQKFLWFLLIIAPLPAALTRDIIQSLRAYFMVLPLSIIAAFGIYQAWEWLGKLKRLGKLGRLVRFGLLGILGGSYLFVFVLFWDRYFIHAPKVNSQFWQYGYKQVVEFIKDRSADYPKVVFTNKYGQPHIYWLLYSQYEPGKYQRQAQIVEHPEGDVGYVPGVGNFEFRNLYWPRDRFEENVLYIGATYEIPDQDIDPKQARVLKDIYFLDGQLAFRIVETL